MEILKGIKLIKIIVLEIILKFIFDDYDLK